VELQDLLAKVVALESEARHLLAAHESSTARTVTLEDSYKRLGKLSIPQDELFRESLRATEYGLFRAAHVLAWAGFIDFLHEYLAVDAFKAMMAVRQKWKLGVPDDLRDQSDYAVIEAGKEAGFYNKTLMKALHGLLNRRNECAHPSEYFPDLNETLGYLSELIQRVAYLQTKSPV
jgi:hypothetical protein